METPMHTTIGYSKPVRRPKRLPPGVVLWQPLNTLGGVRLYPGRLMGRAGRAGIYAVFFTL